MKYILALDNALGTSGYSIFTDQDELVEYGTFKTKTADRLEARLGTIWNKLNQLHNKYEFEEMFFEDCYKQPNMSTYQKLSMVKGTILLWCYFNEISCSYSEPSHWRKVIKDSEHGFGWKKTRAEQKQQAIDLVKALYGEMVISDEADAILIGRAGLLEKHPRVSAF